MSDATEFTNFMNTYQERIHAAVIRLTGDASRAKDITQEVFLKAYENFDAVRQHPAPEAWLMTVAHNESVNLLTRHVRRLKSLTGLFRSKSDGSGGDERDMDAYVPESVINSMETVELREIIEKALMALPKNYREPLLLCEYHGMSYLEIANELGMSVDAVKGCIKRARGSFREILEGYQS